MYSRLLPFDDAVEIHTTQANPTVTVTEVESGTSIPVGVSTLDSKLYYFTSFADGVYEVLILGNSYEQENIVVNNKTLLLLERVRSSILRGEIIYSLAEYEVLLALNYTAIDNWRIGNYKITNAIYSYLADYTLTHNAVNQLTNY